MPTAERGAQGIVERLEEMIADVDGRPGLPWRSLDTLARMERHGSITKPMRQAGDRFHDCFRLAGLEALRAADPTRVPVQLNCSQVIRPHAVGIEGARRAVIEALEALGGILSPGGSCAWYVLGMEETLERWAATRGLGRSPDHPPRHGRRHPRERPRNVEAPLWPLIELSTGVPEQV
jgi:hypothetical protein